MSLKYLLRISEQLFLCTFCLNFPLKNAIWSFLFWYMVLTCFRLQRHSCNTECSASHHQLFYVSCPYCIRVPRYNTENVIRVPRYNTENVILRCAVQKSPHILGEIWVFWSNIGDLSILVFLMQQTNKFWYWEHITHATLNISSASHHQIW